jgi:hypothetical protein
LASIAAAVVATVSAADPKVVLVVKDASGRPVEHARMGQLLTFVGTAKGGGRLPFGAMICVGPVRHARCSAPEYPSPLEATVTEVEHGRFTGRIVMSGEALTVRSIPVRGYPDAKLLITDTKGRAVTTTRAGQVLRFRAVAPEGAALTKWMRVCLRWNAGNEDCAPPGNPYVLVRRVQPELVVDGRVTARVVEFSRTWATKSVSVAG